MPNDALLQELSTRYSQGGLSEKQMAIYDELAGRGVVPEITPNIPVNISPIDIGQQIITTAMGEQLTPEKVTQDGFSKITGDKAIYSPTNEEMDLAARGIDPFSGAPAGIRTKKSLVPKNEQATFLSERMQESLGYPTKVRKDKKTNQLQFLKKGKDGMRWSPIDESGITGADIAEFAEDIPELAGELIASLKSVPLLKGIKSTPHAVAAESGVAAIGAGIGETGRVGLGRLLGYTDANPLESGLEAAEIAAITTLTAGTGMSVGSRLINGKMPYSHEEAQLILGGAEQSKETISYINNRLSGTDGVNPDDLATFQDQTRFDNRDMTGIKAGDIEDLPPNLADSADSFYDIPSTERRFEPTLPKQANLPTILDDEATIRSGRKGLDIERQLREKELGNRDALEDYFDIVSGYQSPDYYGAGLDVKNKLSETTQPILQSIDKRVKEYANDAAATVDSLPAIDITRMSEGMRDSLVEQRALLKTAEKAKWEKVDNLAGYNKDSDISQISIPRDSEIDSAVSRLSIEAKHAIFNSEGKVKKKLLSGDIKGKEQEILGTNGEVLASFFTGGRREFDLVQLNRSISYLKKLERQANSGLVPDLADARDITRIRSALESSRNKYLSKNNPEILNSIEEAEHITKERVDMFDKGVAGKVLRKSNGNYHLDDNGVFNSVFTRNNGQAARRYASAIMSDPRAMQGARNNILAMYREYAVKDGIPNRTLHNKFMKEYKDVITPFFRQNDWKKISRLGNTSSVVESHARRLNALEKSFSKSLRGKIDDMNPEALVGAFFKGPATDSKVAFNQNDVRRVHAYLKEYDPRVLNKYKAAIAHEIRSKISRNGELSSSSLEKLLKETGDLKGGGKLQSLFGGQYSTDLRNLYKALKIKERKGQALPQQGDSVAAIAGKAYFGPISKGSRFTTLGEKFRILASDKSTYEVLSSPDKMRMLMINMDKSADSRRGVEIMATLGMLSAERNKDNQQQ